MTADAILTLHVIYASPSDHPGLFVVRAQSVSPDGAVTPAPDAALCGDLATARQHCESLGLVNIGRMPDDDPVIVEVWI